MVPEIKPGLTALATKLSFGSIPCTFVLFWFCGFFLGGGSEGLGHIWWCSDDTSGSALRSCSWETGPWVRHMHSIHPAHCTRPLVLQDFFF